MFFKLAAASTVIAELRMEFIATGPGALFRAGVCAYTDVFQLFIQIVKQLFLGIERAFQRRQHLVILTHLRRMGTQRLTGPGTLNFSLLQTLTQLLIQIVIAAQHAGRV